VTGSFPQNRCNIENELIYTLFGSFVIKLQPR
jgi:hypothetical protein